MSPRSVLPRRPAPHRFIREPHGERLVPQIAYLAARRARTTRAGAAGGAKGDRTSPENVVDEGWGVPPPELELNWNSRIARSTGSPSDPRTSTVIPAKGSATMSQRSPGWAWAEAAHSVGEIPYPRFHA